VRRLRGASDEEWLGEKPGSLPWWRLGRPPKGEDEDPEIEIVAKRRREVLGPDWRPEFTAAEFVQRVAEALEIDIDELRSRKKHPEISRIRELIMLLGVERYKQKVNELAREIGRSPDGMTKAIARGTQRRQHDQGFLRKLNTIDHLLAALPDGSTR
jgi:chromosomal replication initiation ATPase DnaA